jgi:hypothetical protein
MKKVLFIFCSLLFFNICVFAHTEKYNEISNISDLRIYTEQINLINGAIDVEMFLTESSNHSNEQDCMATLSVTTNEGVKIELRVPCDKIGEAVKAIVKTIYGN